MSDLTKRIILRGRFEKQLEEKGLTFRCYWHFEDCPVMVFLDNGTFQVEADNLKEAEDYQRYEDKILKTYAFFKETWSK